MTDDLGARLVHAGLVTPDLLADVLGEAPPHDGALIRALVRRGVDEDALAGFFVAAGFGPLLEASDLRRAMPEALDGRMACALVALPLRTTTAGLVVAMAAPTDAHALAEIRRAVGGPVLPLVARASELWDALGRAYPGTRPSTQPPPIESEPPILELLRRRREDERARVDRLFAALVDADAAVPLVRVKGSDAARKPPSSERKVVTQTYERPWPATTPPQSEPPEPPRTIIPPEHERWDLDSPPSRSAASVARPTLPQTPRRGRRPPPIGNILAAIRTSHDRDEIVQLACRGALTVSRASILLALRKGVLKGWDGAGEGLTRDAVRNLWIPTSSPSMFRDVVARGEPYEGLHRTSAADGLFRAAMGSRGGEVSIHPVLIAGKIVAVLAADQITYGREGHARIETLARATAEAFQRIILASKRR